MHEIGRLFARAAPLKELGIQTSVPKLEQLRANKAVDSSGSNS